jgi:hypothetical protein
MTDNNNISIDAFTSKEFFLESIVLYYRDQGKRLTNLSKMNKKQLIEVVAKREIPLNDLKRFYNLAIDNKKNMYSYDNESVKLIKLRKKWEKLYIV